MESPNISFKGVLADIDNAISQTKIGGAVNQFLTELQATGCGWFFISSAVISFVTNIKQNKLKIEDAKSDGEFELLLRDATERYEDCKEAEEIAFKIWLRNKQREFAKEESYKRIGNEYTRSDLQLFFEHWPLEITVEAINNRRNHEPVKNTPISVIIGKHVKGEPKQDTLANHIIYSDIVDRVKTQLGYLGIKEDNVYRFKRENLITGGPSIASIYGIMCNLPTIMIVPRVNSKNKLLTISISSWSQDSYIPYHKTLFKLEFDPFRMFADKEYKDNKVNEIVNYYTAISAVLNDVYSLLENGDTPRFPSYAKERNLFMLYPELGVFARNEYSFLIQGESASLLSILNGINSEKEIKKIIENILNEI